MLRYKVSRLPDTALPEMTVPAMPPQPACFLTAVLLLISGCQHASEPASSATQTTAEKPVLETALIRVEQKPWKTVIRSQGGLVSDESTTVGAKVAGRVAAVAVDLGDYVHAGDTLAQLDDVELKLRVLQAEAALSQARAAVGLTPEKEDDDVVVENSPVVRQEKAILDEAKTNFARLQMLRDKNAITQADIDTSAAAVGVAEARYASSLNAVAEKLALIRVRRAELLLAQDMLKDAVIVAPFDGLIQTRQAAAGSYLSVGDPVVTVVRIDPLRYRGTIPERRALNLREGQQVRVLLDGLAEPLVTRITRISPVLEEFSRALVFEADIPNLDGRLRSGLFAEAEVIVDSQAEALTVPASSVVEFAGMEKIWVVKDGTAEEVAVRTGRRDDGQVEIVSGLSAGDTIIRRGVDGRAGPVTGPVNADVSQNDHIGG